MLEALPYLDGLGTWFLFENKKVMKQKLVAISEKEKYLVS